MATHTTKKHIYREKGIPDTFPLQCYFPSPDDISDDEPSIIIGMDSGVGNTAFAYIELIRDVNTKAIVDFRFADAYYFKEQLDLLSLQKDKQIFLCEQYFKLFAHKRVENLTFELLPLTSIKDESTLKGVIDAQSTTNMITLIAYQLYHSYKPVPATSIKLCLTGKGTASKDEMCEAAYSWTHDERLLSNNHMADAFGCAFYSFIQMVKEDCVYYNTPIPEKFAHMDWNFQTMPSPPWGNKSLY